jgi:hypothetical protein
MKCEHAHDRMILLGYGELQDEQIDALEEHLTGCEACRRELAELRQMMARMTQHLPVVEPSPNLLAQSRLRLDDLLDEMPAHGWAARLRGNFWRWVGNVQSAPALATLLVGVGFLGGNMAFRYEAAHAPRLPQAVVLTNTTNGTIANVSGITRTPSSDMVQVNYNRIVPESVQGSLDDPEIRKLLLLGVNTAATAPVREESVNLLATECRMGHACGKSEDAVGSVRHALLVSLRYDKNAGVRLKALEGLEPYIADDQHVRDAVLETLSRDPNTNVRLRAVTLIEPVQADSSVRQVLRTVSTQDTNPYIRTASFNALQGAGDVQ